MSQRIRKLPRESDLEKGFEPQFRAYEEWRQAQSSEEPEEPREREKASKPRKKFAFGRLDLLFIVIGVLSGILFRACQSARTGQ